MLKLDTELFTMLRSPGNDILGRVENMDDEKLVLQTLSSREIDTCTLRMDIFTRLNVPFRNLPVKIVSDKTAGNDIEFGELAKRQITVSFVDLDERERQHLRNMVRVKMTETK